MSSTIRINNRTYTYEGHGNICVVNGELFVDGKKINENYYDLDKQKDIHIEGNCGTIECGGSVTVSGNVDGDVDCGGSCGCGNVDGNIDAGGSVTVSGSVDGDIDAGGSVQVLNRGK